MKGVKHWCEADYFQGGSKVKTKTIYIRHGEVIRGPFATWAEANKAMVEGAGPWKPVKS